MIVSTELSASFESKEEPLIKLGHAKRNRRQWAKTMNSLNSQEREAFTGHDNRKKSASRNHLSKDWEYSVFSKEEGKMDDGSAIIQGN
jgi:hypothetical protein